MVQILFEEPVSRVMRPAIWRDKKGCVHRAIGDEVLPGIRRLWTACGQKDVPAGAAWLQDMDVTCPACREWEVSGAKARGES